MVAGIRNTVPLDELERIDKKSFDQLMDIMATLEGHYRDLCDIEFTIERGKLWMLQTRVGKRTAAAAFVIATQLVDEGVIDLDEALHRVTGAQLAQLMFPAFDMSGHPEADAQGHRGLAGCRGRQGRLHGGAAVEEADKGEKVILVRRETNPDDLPGMIAAQGILTSRGGKTVARRRRRPRHGQDVCLRRRRDRRSTWPAASSPSAARPSPRATSSRSTVRPAAVYLGEVPVQPSQVVQYFEGSLGADSRRRWSRRCTGSCTHADSRARLKVRTNADNGDDSARARRFGAEGIGLCRTEHMFLGDRRELVERLILAHEDDERQARSTRCCRCSATTSWRSSGRCTACR